MEGWQPFLVKDVVNNSSELSKAANSFILNRLDDALLANFEKLNTGDTGFNVN